MSVKEYRGKFRQPGLAAWCVPVVGINPHWKTEKVCLFPAAFDRRLGVSLRCVEKSTLWLAEWAHEHSLAGVVAVPLAELRVEQKMADEIRSMYEMYLDEHFAVHVSSQVNPVESAISC